MIKLELGKLDEPIRLDLSLASVPVAGLMAGDLTIKFFIADGSVATMTGFGLSEVGSDFPGVYLLTDYDEDLVSQLGPAGLKVSAVGIDTLRFPIRVCEAEQLSRKMYQLAYMNLVWDSENSLWQLKDETDTLLGTFPAQDVNGNPAIVDSTHPITRLQFVPAP